MCCKHLVKVRNGCGCRTWAWNMDLWILWCFINSSKEILFHSSQCGLCATLVLVDLSFWGALEEKLGRRFGNQGICAHISLLEYRCQATRHCLRCCLTLVAPWCPSCASWKMRGRSASEITIWLFRKIMPRWCSWPVPSVQALLDGFRSRVRFGSRKKLLKSDGRRKGVNYNGVNVVLNRISRCIGGDRFAWQEVDSILDARLVNNTWAVVLKP